MVFTILLHIHSFRQHSDPKMLAAFGFLYQKYEPKMFWCESPTCAQVYTHVRTHAYAHIYTHVYTHDVDAYALV